MKSGRSLNKPPNLLKSLFSVIRYSNDIQSETRTSQPNRDCVAGRIMAFKDVTIVIQRTCDDMAGDTLQEPVYPHESFSEEGLFS
jgi:hypothetical protein